MVVLGTYGHDFRCLGGPLLRRCGAGPPSRPFANGGTAATSAIPWPPAPASPGGSHSPQVRHLRRRCHIGSLNGDDRLHGAVAHSVLRPADGPSRPKMTDYGRAFAPMGTTSTR